jgi:hypothetical protein
MTWLYQSLEKRVAIFCRSKGRAHFFLCLDFCLFQLDDYRPHGIACDVNRVSYLVR